MNSRDKYDVRGNIEAQFVDADEAILVNKLEITDLDELQIHEEEALAAAYETLLKSVRVDTAMSVELIRYIHELVFGELFEWAGRWRTVIISKPGAIWPPPQFLDQAMQSFGREVLAKHTADTLVSDDEFCRASAEIQGEFLSIHPFREGNARTIKLMNDLLAAQTGRPLLLYDQTDTGRDQYIEAAKAALGDKDYTRLEAIIRQALLTARADSSDS